MIPRSCPTWQTSSWQKELAEAVRDPGTLLQLLGLSRDSLPASLLAAQSFSMRVPLSYIRRMRPADPADPLLLQALPQGQELLETAGFTADPVGDMDSMPLPGLLHKYRGRALLIATGACAIHCRYCFRRHFPYQDAQISGDAWDKAYGYIARDPSLTEVILSGGDPLTLSDDRLGRMLQALASIAHVRRLRIHTRLPVVIPARVTPGLCDMLGRTAKPVVVVLHVNHANEIDAAVREAAQRLRQAGATLLNQAVLLRSVNDTLEAQIHLSEALFEAGILPYYLHLLDPVAGAAHFQGTDSGAGALLSELRKHLPGYLVPRLVRELPGAPGKIPIEISQTSDITD